MDTKMWNTHAMEYYSASEGKVILTHTITWVSLEDILLMERNQLQKDEYCAVALM